MKKKLARGRAKTTLEILKGAFGDKDGTETLKVITRSNIRPLKKQCPRLP